MELTIYEIHDGTVEIADYASVNLTNYYDSYIIETYTITEDTVIAVAADGVLTETTFEEDATNIAVYHAEEGETA